MNTEYAIGNIHLHFESRARRRGLVVLVYAFLAVFDLAAFDMAWIPAQGRSWFLTHSAWLVCGLLIFIVPLLLVFTWLTDDTRRRGDERETHRREHAYAAAYRVLVNFLVAGFLASCLLQGSNPITPLLPPAARTHLAQLPLVLLTATFLVYVSLPQAILLWTEPDLEVETATR
jgi:hypothetical protein